MSELIKEKKKAGTILSRIDRLLARPHPSITDVGEVRQARLLVFLTLIYSLTNFFGILASTASTGVQPIAYVLMGLFTVTVITYILSRTRYYLIGSVLLIIAQSVAGYGFLILNTSGTFTGILSSIVPSIILSTIFLPVGWVAVLMVVDTIGIGIIFLFNPLMTIGFSIESAGSFITVSLLLIVSMIFRNRVERERIREVSNVNKELQEIQIGLEDRVKERTAELADRSQELELANAMSRRRAGQFEAIAQVTRATASLQNLREALSRITESISTQFNYYHVGIFLVDETSQYAVLTASNSAGGQKMLLRGHRLEVGKVGIVGFVTGSGEARIALDTGNDAIYFNNPDLPKTRSEIALPLRSGKRTIGALDVQSTEPNAFGNEDFETLSILADQVSLAIENARLFEQTQRALAESELLNRQYLRQEWERLPKEQNLSGYRYNISGSSALENPIEIQDARNVLERGEIIQQPGENGQPARLTVPVQIRGETIGVLNIVSPEVDEWRQDQIEIVKAVADRVALSAENARLFEETSRRAERERTVSRITTNIRSTNDPQAMLQTALEELKFALGATVINIRPYTPPAQPTTGNAHPENNSRKKPAKNKSG